MATITTQIATIGAGQPMSNMIDCGNNFVVGIIMPPAWTNAPVSILLSLDSTNFYDLFEFGAESTTATEVKFNVKPGAIVAIDPNKMLMARYLRLRSGTRDEPVPQESARVITVVTINSVSTVEVVQ